MFISGENNLLANDSPVLMSVCYRKKEKHTKKLATKVQKLLIFW